jgi:hypothetical protein
MALWQFSLTFLSSCHAKYRNLDAIRLPTEQLEGLPLGLTARDAERLAAGFSILLPEREPWAAGMRVWGDASSDDVQVFFDADGSVAVAFARFDAFRMSIPVIEGVCSLARGVDCVFVTDDGAIIRPRNENVIRALIRSPAMVFAQDPQHFHEGLH